ncbi:MAG: hypothetical protein WD157_01595 [Patescibacteria group bacterium]
MKRLIFSLLTLIALALWSAPALAQDLSSGSALDNLDQNGESFLIPECLQKSEQVRTAPATCVTDTITFYTNLLLLVVAIGAFLYMLYGAFLYATTFGDDAKATQAKKVVTHAIVGIIIAGMSALLVALVKSLLKA